MNVLGIIITYNSSRYTIVEQMMCALREFGIGGDVLALDRGVQKMTSQLGY